jgi:SLT domain-containing protein
MQVIDPTFAAHRDPALSADIWDPMANVVASMRYGIDRYGSLPEAFNQPGGYDNGGPVQPGWTPVYNGGRRAENVLSDAQDQALAQRLRGDSEPKRITGTVRLSRDSEGLLLELVDARIDDANDRTGKALARLR